MKISIITPVFNREDCIIRCLDSVTAQLDGLPADVEVEQIVVDDGSYDKSAAVIRQYAVEHPHVKLIVFPQNRGVAAARNMAVRESTGDWCLLLDSDDWQTSDAILRISDVIKTSPGFLHYMFTVDDRVEEMKQYGSSRIFTFAEFLSESVPGDFVHVISRRVMQQHPFEERLRIYEFNTFLTFYKEVQRVLFTNIALHRIDRNRDDSVSLTGVRYNDDIINRTRLCAQHKLLLYEKDYKTYGLDRIISDLHFEIADNSVLLYDYKTARQHISLCRPSFKKMVVSFVSAMHLAGLYKWMLQHYLGFKHKRPERGVQ